MDLRQMQNEIEDKITELQQQVRFCLNNYDYHHRNSTINILAEKENVLKEASVQCKHFINRITKFQSELNKVRDYCASVDELLLDNNLYTPAEDHYERSQNSESTDNLSIEDDKENRV